MFKNYASILKDEFALDQENTALAKEALEYYLQVSSENANNVNFIADTSKYNRL